MDDATLVSRAVGGERESFGALYDAYAGAVLDLCTAILRNNDEATEATLDSFLRAARELVNLRDRSQLRLWLLAVARHEATSRADRRREGGLPEATSDVPLVWDPADALSMRDRAILHLHLRHQLEGEELAAVVGVRPAVAEARAAKLREMAETSVGALLLTRTDTGTAPSTCAGLAAVLDGWDGEFTPAIGAKVDRHARKCDACQARRTMLLERLQAMASLPFASPPPWLREEVMLRMELAVTSRRQPGWGEDGFPPGIAVTAGAAAATHRRRPRKGMAAAVGVALAALTSAGTLLVLHDWDNDSTLRASDRSTSTTIGNPATTVLPAVTAAPAPTTATAGVPQTTVAVAGTQPPGTQPPGTQPLVGPPPFVPDREPPGIAFGADAASTYVFGCPYSRTGVVADVGDQSSIVWVALFVRRPDGVEESINMAPDGGRWVASMGDFDTAGQAVFWVEASDSEGNQGRGGDQVLDVFLCE